MRCTLNRFKLCRVEMWRGGLGWAYLLPALWSAGASLAQPCSVSTSRSSNRTGGFPASGSRRRRTLLRVTRSATSEHLLGLPGSSPIPRSLVALRVSLQLRPLPSTGVTRLPRCRVGGGALARWPPSAAQTARAVFPHAAFTKMLAMKVQAKGLTQPDLPAHTRRTAALQATSSSPHSASACTDATGCGA